MKACLQWINSSVPEKINYFKCYNWMRNLHKFILKHYGIGSLRLLRDWEKCQLRQCDFKNHGIFTLRCMYSELVPVSIRLKSTLKSERAKKILRTAEKQLLQTRLKSINSLLDNNATQLELTRSKIASILTPLHYQACQDFIDKIKEKRFIKARERWVRKLNNLINKKEGVITWQSSQAARAFPQANNWQAGRLTHNASPQISQSSPGERALPQSLFSQAGSSQASLADSTLASSALFQAGSSQASPAGSTLASSALSQAGSSQAGSSQAGSSQASPAGSTPASSVLSQAGSSQAGSSHASPEDSTLSESALSQAGNSQASLEENTLSLAEWALPGQSPSSPEDSTLQAERPIPPQAVRWSARLRARQAGNSSSEVSKVSQQDNALPQGVSPQDNASQEAGSFPSRHHTPQGSSSLEEPNPKWVINLSSKPLTTAQRSVLAKGPNFAVTPRHPPNLKYITAIEAACTKLSQQDAEELRANINWVLRSSHCP